MFRFVPLGGYLGAGKTTTMLAAARRLERAGERVSVITNDQGADLVDTRLVERSIERVGQVTGGCFCCRFEDLTAVIAQLRAQREPTVVIAEAVGSCTDLQATVVRPLREYHGHELEVAPLTALVDPLSYAVISRQWEGDDGESELAYLYRQQLEEADIVALNKVDLLEEDKVAGLIAALRARFPHARVVPLSALKRIGVDELSDLWSGFAPHGERRIEVDYERYGAAEAQLAWTNQVLELRGRFAPAAWAEQVLRSLAGAGHTIGHLKLIVETPDGVTKASLAREHERPAFDERQWLEADSGTATLNARVECEPHELERLVDRTLASVSAALGVEAEAQRGDVFRPAFPVPVHRL